METAESTGKVDWPAGVLLVGAAVIMATGAAIGFVAPSLREAPWEGDLTAIAGNPTAHVWANGLILAAGILTTLGLVALSLRFQGPGRSWAWMGMVAFAFAAVFLALDRILSMEVATWAATQDLNDKAVTLFEAFERFDEGLTDWFYILGFLSLSLYGVAIEQRDRANGLGWAFVASGIFGIILQAVGATIPAMVFFGTAALGLTTFRLGAAPTSNAQTA